MTMNDLLSIVGRNALVVENMPRPGCVTVCGSSLDQIAAIELKRPCGIWFRHFQTTQHWIDNLGARIDAFETRR